MYILLMFTIYCVLCKLPLGMLCDTMVWDGNGRIQIIPLKRVS